MGLQAGMQGVSLTRSELSAARSKGQIERYQCLYTDTHPACRFLHIAV